jgi:hypothetical protein
LAISQMHESLTRVRLLLGKARDDRNPLTLTCVSTRETETRALLQVSRDDYRALRAGSEDRAALDRILGAASRSHSLESDAFACQSRPEPQVVDIDAKSEPAPQPDLEQILNPTPPWQPLWPVFPPPSMEQRGPPPASVSR